ncbi:MAG: AbiH family protein [Oscillospiraceae bacterium]
MKTPKNNNLRQGKVLKDTLIIIGNGFDVWQGLDTRYSDFHNYYLEHRDEIMKKLGIKNLTLTDENGQRTSFSAVELLYGDPFSPGELDSDFWTSFETSMDKIDSEKINLFYGKERNDLRAMDKSIRDAKRILTKAYCDWIATLTIDHRETPYHFGDNCVFINFNYTDTLLKRFHVQELDEFHIHGEVSDKSSIIFGHSSHPQLPEPLLQKLGGRFGGLFLIEKLLYETDKHVQNNICLLCMFLASHGIIAEQIKNVYVLGHSMGTQDLEYFEFLSDATRLDDPANKKSCDEKVLDSNNTIEELDLRLQYSINRFGYSNDEASIDPDQTAAVQRRFALEQEARIRVFDKMFFKQFKKSRQRTARKIAEPIEFIPRDKDAMWHISYYSELDKFQAENAMQMFGYGSYKLYPTIDECLASFRQ